MSITPERVNAEELYDIWSENYDQHPNAALKLEEPVVLELLGDVDGRRILDIGAGTGRWAIRLASMGANVTAVEPSEGMRSVMKSEASRNGVAIEIINGTATDFSANGEFDYILMSFVLSHVEDAQPVFDLIGNHLAENGVVIITENPTEFSEDKSYDFKIIENQYVTTMYRWAEEEISQVARQHGLQIFDSIELLVDETVKDIFDAKPHKDYTDFVGTSRGTSFVIKRVKK